MNASSELVSEFNLTIGPKKKKKTRSEKDERRNKRFSSVSRLNEIANMVRPGLVPDYIKFLVWFQFLFSPMVHERFDLV